MARYLSLLLLCLTLLSPALAREPKKILYIDSYHPDYAWSGEILRGIREGLEGTKTDLQIHYLDTKRNRDEAYKRDAAIRARALIEEYRPDLLIACDDNALKYLVSEYYANTRLPVVFCGLNSQPEHYGLIAKNITGMVEVDLIEALVSQLKRYASGDRIGLLGISSLTSEIVVQRYERLLGNPLSQRYLVDTYAEWVQRYIQMQDEVDLLIIGNTQGLAGWDEQQFIQVALEHTRIPTGTTGAWLTRYTLMGYLHSPKEHGRWSAENALKILDGTPPSSIPITRNREGNLVLNLGIASRMGVTFDPALTRHAQLIHPYKSTRLLYVAKPHTLSRWEEAFIEALPGALQHSGVELRVRYLKPGLSPRLTVQQLQRWVDQFDAGIVMVCSDDLLHQLIAARLTTAPIPVLFCGTPIRIGAAGLLREPYFFQQQSISLRSLIQQLQRYAQGKRIGYLAFGSANEANNLQLLQSAGIILSRTLLVSSMQEWKQGFRAMQREVDMLLIGSHIGIPDWDPTEAAELANSVLRIPTGTTIPWSMPYAVLGFVHSPNSLGVWSARNTLRILDGVAPRPLKLDPERDILLMLNRKLLSRLDVVIDSALYSRAMFVE